MEKEQCFRLFKSLIVSLQSTEIRFGKKDSVNLWQKQYKDLMKAILELEKDDVNWIDEKYKEWQNTEEFKNIPDEIKGLFKAEIGE